MGALHSWTHTFHWRFSRRCQKPRRPRDVQENLVRRNGRPLLGSSGPNCCNLIRLSANLFSGTLSRQSLLQSALIARLQVVGVTLHFLNDVFRLNLALEPTKGILQRLALLQSNFCQTHHPQTSSNRTY